MISQFQQLLQNTLKKIRGFTLIELMATILILGIVAAAAAPTARILIIRKTVETNLLPVLNQYAELLSQFNREYSASYRACFLDLLPDLSQDNKYITAINITQTNDTHYIKLTGSAEVQNIQLGLEFKRNGDSSEHKCRGNSTQYTPFSCEYIATIPTGSNNSCSIKPIKNTELQALVHHYYKRTHFHYPWISYPEYIYVKATLTNNQFNACSFLLNTSTQDRLYQKSDFSINTDANSYMYVSRIDATASNGSCP